VTDKWTDGRAE